MSIKNNGKGIDLSGLKAFKPRSGTAIYRLTVNGRYLYIPSQHLPEDPRAFARAYISGHIRKYGTPGEAELIALREKAIQLWMTEYSDGEHHIDAIDVVLMK